MQGWDSCVELDPCARKELEFWENNVSNLNSRSFLNTVRKPSRIVYSDASATGCAAFIAIDDTPVSYINWDSLQMNQSSAGRELPRVSFALKRFAHLLSGCDVKWFTDNQAVPSIVHSGTTYFRPPKIIRLTLRLSGYLVLRMREQII